MHGLKVRRLTAEDTEATARIYYDAVHIGAAGAYDAEQREAWAPRIPEHDLWCERLSSLSTWVAEIDEGVVGFMTLAQDGSIDFAFVAPSHIGRGVAKALYDRVLAKAHERRMPRLHTEASHLARRFFERQGWMVVSAQYVVRREATLRNFVMEKNLD